MNKKKTGVILIAAALIIASAATIVVLCSASRPKAEQITSTTVSSHGISIASIAVPSVSSETTSSAAKSSTAITVDVTQSKAAYTARKPNTTKTPDVSVAANSKSHTSSTSGNSKTSTASSSKPQIPNVPASQEIVTKTIGNNTVRLNVNAFTFETFVDWSDVQNYLFDDFYVKVYKNGVLKSGPDLYGCVTKDPTNTVAVEIDTYQSNGHWYIQPATYKIECYSKLSEHSLVKDNRPQIIPCPSATFTVSINEKGFQ